ncbi:hypothetical protein [Anaeromyxobacter oryzisoli]|uniref:hypothetical protein n=1 Tax=Anaeromyxobacter oryzisoli TaxID=2925408 RepID=UPI001F56A3DF|nr:hypothetical protein [Anaeromyxobacter sp. SG63]
MATLQQQIADAFLTRLAQTKEFDPTLIEELRRVLSSGRKLKADDFIKIFSTPAGGDLR